MDVLPQALYKEALEVNPHSVNILSNYGLFLSEVDIHTETLGHPHPSTRLAVTYARPAH